MYNRPQARSQVATISACGGLEAMGQNQAGETLGIHLHKQDSYEFKNYDIQCKRPESSNLHSYVT
jgi:hypothetical protein